jgi:hypothetical protein
MVRMLLKDLVEIYLQWLVCGRVDGWKDGVDS